MNLASKMDTIEIDGPPVSPKTVPPPHQKPHARSESDPPPSLQEARQGLVAACHVGGTSNSKRKGHRARHPLGGVPGLDGAMDGVETGKNGRNGRGADANRPNTPNNPNTKKSRKGKGKKKRVGRIDKNQYTRTKAMKDDKEEALMEQELARMLEGMAQRNETRADRAMRRNNDGGVAAGALTGRLAREIQSNTIEDVPTPDGDMNNVADLLAGVKVDEMKRYREQKGEDSDDEMKPPERAMPVSGQVKKSRMEKKSRTEKKKVIRDTLALADTIEALKW
ncbi:hypothetical protein BDZ45DRAFT_809116 [Acephala macrosclerotiorum]|nr:hypothetical protein BDZ45DRAFT_809116 [Acephala macrosclerotiorum]